MVENYNRKKYCKEIIDKNPSDPSTKFDILIIYTHAKTENSIVTLRGKGNSNNLSEVKHK